MLGDEHVDEILHGRNHATVGSCRTGKVAVEVVHRVVTVYVSLPERGNLADMQIAMVGLGRMGANMVRRLRRAGHDCVAYDVNGVRHDEMPVNQSDFHHAVPIYEYLPGWWEDLGEARTLADLPPITGRVRPA